MINLNTLLSVRSVNHYINEREGRGREREGRGRGEVGEREGRIRGEGGEN